MTEPPRPPGDDPTTPHQTPGGYPPPPPPSYSPPTSGAGSYPPPAYGESPYEQQSPYGQQPSYGPPQYGPTYNPVASADDRTWILVAHFGGAIGAFLGGGFAGWIGPLVAYLARGNMSTAVRAEAAKALNFQLLWMIVALVGYAGMCILIGFVIVPVAWLMGSIFGLIAGIKASNGEPYNYPGTVNWIK